MDKLQELKEWMGRQKGVAVAFSGGVDSALLLALAAEVLKDNVIALTGDSASVPAGDRKFVVKFCKNLDVKHRFIKTNEFDLEEYRLNPNNRCYYCKSELFKRLVDFVVGTGSVVLDGTNATDLTGHRPGYRAIRETPGVKTPYIELGIGKGEIRQMAKRIGIEVADKPSSACLASRIPEGRRIEPLDLEKVDRAEDILKEMGFSQVRVRHHGDLARIQCIEKELGVALELRRKIDNKFKKLGYKFVTLDVVCYE